jgi:hypothetical protein
MSAWEIWRYTRTGRSKHALRYSSDHVAECGVGPGFGEDWLGTGRQSEYEKCAVLPACKRCLALGYRP